MIELKTTINHEGQRYYHEEVRREIRPLQEFTTTLAWAMKESYGLYLPPILYAVVGHNKVKLNWLSATKAL